jgi:hypothetical protein
MAQCKLKFCIAKHRRRIPQSPVRFSGIVGTRLKR